MKFLLGDRKGFENASPVVVRTRRAAIEANCNEGLLHYFPPAVLDGMKDHRKTLRMAYQEIALSLPWKVYSNIDGKACRSAHEHFGYYYGRLAATGVCQRDIPEDFDLPDVYSTLSKLTPCIARGCKNGSPYGDAEECRVCKTFVGPDRLKDIFSDCTASMAKVPGRNCKLCFDCFEERKFGLVATCRKHLEV